MQSTIKLDIRESIAPKFNMTFVFTFLYMVIGESFEQE